MDKQILSPKELRAGVIHSLVSRLGDAGKIKIQKLAYFLQEAYHVPLECTFNMHHYGPYSEDVESSISNLKLMGYVNVQADADGYGFHVTSASPAEPGWTTMTMNVQNEIDEAIAHLGYMNASELELAATIHYVKNSLGFDKEAVLSSVRARKPKFSQELISRAYDKLDSQGLLD